jgi:hypothetical protein
MSTTPTRPNEIPPFDEETQRIIEQRLATFDEDRKSEMEALEMIRKTSNTPRPVDRVL